ncbi:hypothetical protein EYF80_021267 [Liparis tanakae]|uniref:Uncharacterized protein n=1 Tax=Liparis tanakae TaxID=230148 RepID=A0A4Z2HUB8_9TELE|nr:hypothetical protein EYF80_021267 [Liparis tanakae]
MSDCTSEHIVFDEALLEKSDPSAGLQVSYLVRVKLLFDFFHIVRHLLLDMQGILGRQQPGQDLLQRGLVDVQVHFQQAALRRPLRLRQAAGGLWPGAAACFLHLHIL